MPIQSGLMMAPIVDMPPELQIRYLGSALFDVFRVQLDAARYSSKNGVVDVAINRWRWLPLAAERFVLSCSSQKKKCAPSQELLVCIIFGSPKPLN
jgi:hypothetical protein